MHPDHWRVAVRRFSWDHHTEAFRPGQATAEATEWGTCQTMACNRPIRKEAPMTGTIIKHYQETTEWKPGDPLRTGPEESSQKPRWWPLMLLATSLGLLLAYFLFLRPAS